ncbi:MAG: response regulator transcription factor [Actinobacteria bacterium]|nr:response regulator transcription factor [Actinomycetota bacterium]
MPESVPVDPGILDEPIRLLIADDNRATREMLRDLLPGEGFQIVGDASDGPQAYELACSLRPEVVLMDLRMPGIDGIQATTLIKTQVPRTQIVVLTAFPEGDSRWAAKLVGAVSFLDKDAPLDELVEALRAAAIAYRTQSV